ncbi:MAG: hypothetical protein B7C24_11800 [Bacteroidetes bacterium 4572_77]|nr:MAG: hypothetical protein B7C24_11800 [Bacteroidetes bacterium 4572_77]
MTQILLASFYLIVPAIILFLCKKSSIIKKMGSIVVAYAIGILLGISGILPEGSAQIQDLLISLSIPLAIPLLLFPTKIKDWAELAGPSLKALLVGLISVVVIVFVGYFLFKPDESENFWKVGALLIGVYSGGTPNLASLKAMLQVSNETYIVIHSYDDDLFDKLFNKKSFIPLLKAFGLALLIFGISAGFASLFPPDYLMIVVILSLSTLALAASFIPGVNKIDKSFDLGMYFILVFSVTVASLINPKELVAASLDLIYYPAFVIFGSLLLQSLISRFTKTDADTLIITSTALICSPPFVPVVCSAINNRNLLVPGITIGVIGYAIGNYLGFLVGEALKIFG